MCQGGGSFQGTHFLKESKGKKKDNLTRILCSMTLWHYKKLTFYYEIYVVMVFVNRDKSLLVVIFT